MFNILRLTFYVTMHFGHKTINLLTQEYAISNCASLGQKVSMKIVFEKRPMDSKHCVYFKLIFTDIK